MNPQPSQDPFRYWSDKIEQEHLSPFGGQEEIRRHHAAVIVLRSLRLHAYLHMGTAAPPLDVREEFQIIARSVQVLEGESQPNGRVLPDALELIALLDDDGAKLLLRAFPFAERHRLQHRGAMGPELFNAALALADVCHLEDMSETGCLLLYRLARRSALMGTPPAAHRIIIFRIMNRLAEQNWESAALRSELLCRIGSEHASFFETTEDTESCCYYWYYGVTLYQAQDFDRALPLLQRCIELCEKVLQPTDWLPDRARQLCAVYQLNYGEPEPAEAFLWQYVANLDAEYYTDPAPEWELVRELTRHQLLYHRLNRAKLSDCLPHLLKFAAYCAENEELVCNPILTRKNSYTLLGAYYLEVGAYLQAAQYSMEALTTPTPEGVDSFVPEDVLFSNLLNIFCNLRDKDQIQRLSAELSQRIDQAEAGGLADSNTYRFRTIISTAKLSLGYRPDEEELADYRTMLQQHYRKLVSGPGLGDGRDGSLPTAAYALWITDMIQALLTFGSLSPEELAQARSLLAHFRDDPQRYQLNRIQHAAIYFTMAVLADLQNAPDALALMLPALDLAGILPPENEIRQRMETFAAVLYQKQGDFSRSADLALRTLESITDAWHSAMTYLNDNRVCQFLETSQTHSRQCLAVLSESCSPRKLYEQILLYKDLSSLAGRERSRILRLSGVDDGLRDRIYRLQDELAAAQLRDSLQDTQTAAPIADRLLALEAEFAARFPQNNQFTPISLQKICARMESDSAVLEYFFLPDSTGTDEILEVFLTIRTGGRARLHHFRSPGALALRETALSYVELLRDPDQCATDPEMESNLRTQLQKALIAPVLPLLEDVRSLYIAPDLELCNLPFEILRIGGRKMLQDRFRICRLVCGRDLLFGSVDAGTASGCFILGDPDYEAEIGERTPGKERYAGADLSPVDPLPFSGLEAWRVGRLCHSPGITGKAATKFALGNALPAGIIHLATHGVFDPQMQHNSLYGAYLIFAGYNRWVTEKTESQGCGSGILTADEISRSDLRRTELVVLSACSSAMEDTSSGAVRGLVSAFSAAGSRWVVCHLWNADDFASAVLMDAFYKAHLTFGMEVPDALQHAKAFLRSVTMLQLRDDGWFDPDHLQRLSPRYRDYLLRFARKQDRIKPFLDEHYWGGFVCYRCN